MIGLSLSFCVRDLANGDVDLDDVEKIIAGTAAENDADWEWLVGEYQKTYWSRHPARSATIARTLRLEGKIFQPRLGSAPRVPRYDPGRHWVRSESEVVLLPAGW